MKDGQPFNPFGLFTGIFVPEGLARSKDISAGAKLVFGRLARYAGEDGKCFPGIPRLANQIGTSVRQTQRYLSELEEIGLIEREDRYRPGSREHTSNAFHFIWHPILETLPDLSVSPRGDGSDTTGVTNLTPPITPKVGLNFDESGDYRGGEFPKRVIEENQLNNINDGVAPRLRDVTEEEWPQTTALVQGRFLSVDAPFMWRFIHAAIQAVVSSGGNAEELTDKNLAWMVEEVFKNPKIYSAGLLLRAVPTMVENLVKRHAKVMR